MTSALASALHGEVGRAGGAGRLGGRAGTMTSMEALAAARISLDLANRRAAKLLETHPTVKMKAVEKAVWTSLCAKDEPAR